MATLLRVRNLKVHISINDGVIKAVDGVSFRVPEGKTVALVGESGSGKSIVAQSIMGILPKVASVVEGEILFYDPDRRGAFVDIARLPVESAPMRAIRGGRISIIFQEPMTALSPVHTVGNQIGEALHLHRAVDDKTGRELTIEMLRMVGFPDPVKAYSTYPFELSGGLRQRAMIAMALVCRPALLIADEPTTALDVTIQAQILKLIKDLQSELKMAVLMITHDLGVVANMADEVVVMYHGKVMERGGLHDIYRDPRHPYLVALMRAVPRFDMAPGERLTPIREIKATTDGLLKRRETWPAEQERRRPLLRVEGLTKSFTTRKGTILGLGGTGHKTVAVDDVTFHVTRGECLGLVGESGCGKTTASKLLLRAIPADKGTITWTDRQGDTDVRALEGKDLFDFRRKVQFIFQDPYSSLNPRMTVADIISEPLLIHRVGDAAERFERVRELMTLVGLDVRYLRRYPHSFSGGQRQRIGIARALALRPELLICDEPVSALDVSIQAQVMNLLKDLQTELSLTYLFISHNLAVVNYLADRIAVMCAGRLVETAPSSMLFETAVHPYTRALLSAVPKPDPGARLDLSALMQGKASNPRDWPRPFTVDDATPMAMIDLGRGHSVRAAASADARELQP